MHIPDEIRKRVAYVGFEKFEGISKKSFIGGTGFFVGLPVPNTSVSIVFFVTARHVVDDLSAAGTGQVFLRINSRAGTQWFEVPSKSWIHHPDPTVDVSVVAIDCDGSWEVHCFPFDAFATQSIIEEEVIGIGSDIFISGLFRDHPGEERNIPIIRVGNIAAMLEEPVKVTWKNARMEAYLVECRSIGGLSGSPVFVYIGASQFSPDGGIAHRGDAPAFYLLGLMHGHWNWPNVETQQDQFFKEEKLNMGIAIVVPSQKIAEVFKLDTIEQMLIAWEHELDSHCNPPVNE